MAHPRYGRVGTQRPCTVKSFRSARIFTVRVLYTRGNFQSHDATAQEDRRVLSFLQDIPIVLAAIVGSLASWWLVRRLWPPERRRVHNEITGWQISVLGTTYAVIIGFMLFAAWSDFRAADQNAMAEASCLINLYWTSSGLPAGQRDAIRKLSADYADAMIADEWPAMNRGVVSPTGPSIPGHRTREPEGFRKCEARLREIPVSRPWL
jgi:hypothetical protein